MNLRILSHLTGTLLLSLCVSCASSTAQSSEAELPAPELTEVWTPKVPVVSAPPNGVPSDAIVLFNGQSLDEWQPVTPGGKRWKIEGDAMVIVRQASDEPVPTEGDEVRLDAQPGTFHVFDAATGVRVTTA